MLHCTTHTQPDNQQELSFYKIAKPLARDLILCFCLILVLFAFLPYLQCIPFLPLVSPGSDSSGCHGTLLTRLVTHICLVMSFIRMYQGPDEEMRLISIGRPPNWCCPYKASILSSALAAPFPNLSTIHCGSLLCAGLGWAELGWAGQNIKNFAAFIWLSSSSRHAASETWATLGAQLKLFWPLQTATIVQYQYFKLPEFHLKYLNI